ncbi:MAG TPA: epimerase, partial [Chitinophagaceae bacterium]
MSRIKNKKIVIPGGSGFIGQALARYFGEENEVVILSRQRKNVAPHSISLKGADSKRALNIRSVKWDGKTLGTTWCE